MATDTMAEAHLGSLMNEELAQRLLGMVEEDQRVCAGNPDLQRHCLPLLKEAVAQHRVDPVQVAYLEDRICFFERRAQRRCAKVLDKGALGML